MLRMVTFNEQGYMDLNNALEFYQFEKLNQALFNNHPDAIYILDLEGKFKMVNEEVCRITGIEREQLIGSSFAPLIPAEYLERTTRNFQLALQDAPQRYETAVNTESGIRHIDVTNFPLKVEGNIVAVFGIAKDITGKKQKAQELQAYAALLKAKNEELEVFRRVLAHDMRKPVANAIGFAKLLTGGMLPMEKEGEVKSLLLKTVESIDAMVRELNEAIAQKTVGGEAKVQLNVHAAVSRLLTFFTNEISKINATVTLDIAPDLTLYTVKVYFDSILRNLISNALKYHSRSHSPTLLVRAAVVGNGMEITVKDNGIGMDIASVSEELFKMHKRFAPSLAEGYGLGLFIVHEQVKLLSGTISVSSESGVGTEFKIFLPIG